MKTLVVVVALLVTLVFAAPHHEETEPILQQLKLHGDECAVEHNINVEERKQWKHKAVENPSEDLKCYTNCIMEKLGTLKDGVVQEHVLLTMLSAFVGEEKAKEKLEACKDVSGANKCEKALNMYNCFDIETDHQTED